MKKSTLFRTLKEVGAYNAYKTNISTGKFDITEIEHASDPHHYLNSVRAFEWSKTIQGWLFWKLKLMEIDRIAIYGKKNIV